MAFKVGNGTKIRFWEDVWRGEVAFQLKEIATVLFYFVTFQRREKPYTYRPESATSLPIRKTKKQKRKK